VNERAGFYKIARRELPEPVDNVVLAAEFSGSRMHVST